VIGDYKSCDIVYDFPATYRLQQMQLAGRELSAISTNKKKIKLAKPGSPEKMVNGS